MRDGNDSHYVAERPLISERAKTKVSPNVVNIDYTVSQRKTRHSTHVDNFVKH